MKAFDKTKMTLLGLLSVIAARGRGFLKDQTEILVQTGDRVEPAELIVRYRSASDPTPVMVFVPASEFESLSEEAHTISRQVQDDPLDMLQRFLNVNLRETAREDR